jgi:hypothetical protein
VQDLALKSVIRHLLLIQFKETAIQAQINAMFEQFADLKPKINGVASIEYGANQNPEKLNKNFTHAVVVTFSNFAARDEYLIHPDHKDLEAVLLSLLADLVVLDIEC